MSGHNAKRFQHLCLHEQVNWQRFREVWMAAPIQSIAEFATAIEATTGHAPKLCQGLQEVIDQAESTGVGRNFFTSTLPDIIGWARKCEENDWKWPLLLTTAKGDATVTEVSGVQATSLLANMFLCTVPPPIAYHPHMPDFNSFFPLFCKTAPQEVAKLQMFIAFFETATEELLQDTKLTFRRTSITRQDTSSWEAVAVPMQPVQVMRGGFIEDDANAIQVDFANAMIGGGVLCGGCVQEEIRFATCPLFTTSLLVFSEMDRLDAIHIVSQGVTAFTRHTGYAFGLRFGERVDVTVPQPPVCLTAIDAIPMPRGELRTRLILREMNKAYAGFRCGHEEALAWKHAPIATGNWGCGAFGGSVWVKSVLQWLAASRAGRPMKYYMFDAGEEFATSLEQLSTQLCNDGVTVARVYDVMLTFAQLNEPPHKLHAFLAASLAHHDA